MPDREKVIRAFEQYVYNFIELTTTDEYNHQILEQVLVLLKEQEAVEPYSMNAERTYGICPKCGKIVFRYGNVEENHYCGVCGQAVKWE